MGQPLGRILALTELRAGDPRLPRTTGDGAPWPRECGALVATAQLAMNTTAGREAFEIIKFFGPASTSFSIGYQVDPNGGAVKRGGVRYIRSLSIFEISLVLHGAAPLARGLSIKSAPGILERKATAGTGIVGAHRVVACDVCGRPTAAIAGGPPPGLALVCSRCVANAHDTDTTGHLGEDDLRDAAELDEYLRDAGSDPHVTTDDAYQQAREEEVRWDMVPDGELYREDDGPADREGLAWRQHGRRSRYQA